MSVTTTQEVNEFYKALTPVFLGWVTFVTLMIIIFVEAPEPPLHDCKEEVGTLTPHQQMLLSHSKGDLSLWCSRAPATVTKEALRRARSFPTSAPYAKKEVK